MEAKRAEFLTFRLGSEDYAIDIHQVREIRAHESITRIAGAPAAVRGVIDLRGTVVPIVDLRLALGFEGATASSVLMVLVLDERLVGVTVDTVEDVIAIAERDVRPPPELAVRGGSGLIRGIASAGTRVLLLLDMEACVGRVASRRFVPEAA